MSYIKIEKQCVQHSLCVFCLGYSIFIVFGELPISPADDALLLRPAVQSQKPKLLSEVKQQSSNQSTDDDSELQTALRMSMGEGSLDYVD